MGLYRDAAWARKMFDRHFQAPILSSIPFLVVTILFLIVMAREVWLVATGWAAIPSGLRVAFGVLVVLTPFMWVRVLLQHRQIGAAVRRLEDPVTGGLSLHGAIAMDSLTVSAVAYLLLALALTVLQQIARRG
jgi:hypothetical protein